MKVLTGVRAVLSAAHRSKDGHIHGHTWEIVAWYEGSPDAVEKQAELVRYLSIFDHQVLADGVAWGEKLGEAILIGMGCAKVEVRRPIEGIFAEVTRDDARKGDG
jgi:6-pyruvoyl-tetrahydropterin synthase